MVPKKAVIVIDDDSNEGADEAVKEVPLELEILGFGTPRTERAISKLRKSWPIHDTIPRFKSRGLHNGLKTPNKGNKCYRNALLQCLFHAPVFAQWLRFTHPTPYPDLPIDEEFTKTGRRRPDPKDLPQFARTGDFQSPDVNHPGYDIHGQFIGLFVNHTPDNAIKSIKWCQHRHCMACSLKNLLLAYWSDGGQEPFREECSSLQRVLVIHGWPSGGAQDDNRDLWLKIFEAMSQHLTKERDVLDGMFRCTANARLICLTCGFSRSSASNTSNPYLMINLGSDAKDRSIDELLKDHFASIPTGPGDCEEWRCTTNLIDHRIEHEFRAERMGQERMVALPEVLVLSLGRFSGTVENGEWVGVHREDVITTTETLDFSRWCQPVLPDKTIQYGLVGTSFHSGDLDAGHFKARVRDATNHWKECNDDKVSASSLRAALRAKDKQFLPNLFVYQRIHS